MYVIEVFEAILKSNLEQYMKALVDYFWGVLDGCLIISIFGFVGPNMRLPPCG